MRLRVVVEGNHFLIAAFRFTRPEAQDQEGLLADAARRQTVTKAALLRERLADTSHPVILIGTHNALVGRLLERAGVDGGWVSSFEMSATHGLPTPT